MLKSNAVASGRRVFSYSISPEMYNRLSAVSKTRGCSKSHLITVALEDYLREAEEDARDYEIAAAAWKEFEESGGKTYTTEELRKELGL